ncbi:MAG: ABC transporter ATP-binding protein [Nitriliruptoraceae bacterium]
MALLELTDVAAGYGAAPDILNGISLEIEADRTYCIIGPNGAGKSTLLKAMCGLLHPRAGRVVLDGEDIGGLRPDQIFARGLCFVPQDRAVFPQMTVRENLNMGAFLERDRSVIAERLERVHHLFPILEERHDQRAGTLSGGQQQMVVLGRALMLDPRVMLIDEPSLGIAPQLADQIFQTIGEFASLGIAVVLVEQNVRRGLQAAEWGYVLDLGTLRFEGPADEILNDPRLRELYLGRQSTATTDGGDQ